MNETANSVGMIGLGALFATTIFLTVLVVMGSRFFRWLKGAGFRFQDFEAHQDGDGVRLNSSFKRSGFEAKRGGFTRPTAPAAPAPAFFEAAPEPEPEPFDEIVAIAEEDMQANTRVSLGSKPNHVQIAIATESDVGFTMHRVTKGKEVRLRVPRASIQPIGVTTP